MSARHPANDRSPALVGVAGLRGPIGEATGAAMPTSVQTGRLDGATVEVTA